jgi:REP element-mobilizing transposase RayT
MPRHATQLTLVRTAGWGGARRHAGRKRRTKEQRVAHAARPRHVGRLPVHVTYHLSDAIDHSLREPPVYPALEQALRAASKPAFRVVHFSVQENHLHLLVEAADHAAFVRGLQGLAVRAARAVNRALGLRGRVWADRYHARVLTTPSEVRRGIIYVVQNRKKTVAGVQWVDACSSAWFFDGWKGPRPWWSLPPPGERPVGWAPRTWLLSVGWQRAGGLIDFKERPKVPPPETARGRPR